MSELEDIIKIIDPNLKYPLHDNRLAHPAVSKAVEILQYIRERDKRLNAAEWYCNEDGESFGDLSDATDDIGIYDYTTVTGCKEVSRKYAAKLPVTFDDEGSPDEVEVKLFDTKEEVEEAIERVKPL
jgi:CRISPR/Cas system-associated endonuclease/helicase Cas3